ncbi:phage tail assembly chaperone [Hyphococcus sp. DH-69]|uniref:phage tail assembly chaperone n=1 Tax=Hyphococcus formosus TaxID=3143534 RepID=UPI00398B5035
MMLRFAVASMGVMPQCFWQLSVHEWNALTQTPRGMGQQDLAQLIEQIEGDRNGGNN